MLRPRGKAARIHKEIFSLEETMPKKQGYNARMDESLGERHRGRKKQSLKDRRDEAKGMLKHKGKRAYSSVKTMDKARRKKK